MTPSFARARIIALAAPAALLAGAYISEYGFGLWPCEMCWWQRYAHFAALVPAALAFVVPMGLLRIWFVRLAGLAILVSAGIGAFHAGVEYDWWEGLTSCSSALQAKEGQSALDAIMAAPTVRCDDVQFSFLGISMAGWNFVISGLAGLLVLVFSARTAPGRVG